jgi:hypothetical protein
MTFSPHVCRRPVASASATAATGLSGTTPAWLTTTNTCIRCTAEGESDAGAGAEGSPGCPCWCAVCTASGDRRARGFLVNVMSHARNADAHMREVASSDWRVCSGNCRARSVTRARTLRLVH